MAEDKIGDIASEAKEQPVGARKSTAAPVTGKLVSQSGLPMKHEAKKMPHEHFMDKMAGSLTGDCH